jgi:hypothetical protein
MAQNTSSAVMQQRHEAPDSLDDFPTPCWATRALLSHIIGPEIGGVELLKAQTCWEPACNRGFMARPLAEYFKAVRATDIFPYGWAGQEEVRDFLWPGAGVATDWVISNPPFRLAEQFIGRGLGLARVGVAMIVRTSFLEGVGRHAGLYSDNPPTIVAQYAERVPMVKGRCDPTASTATSYCWVIWLVGQTGTKFTWLPPCRRQLERDGDYDEQ